MLETTKVKLNLRETAATERKNSNNEKKCSFWHKTACFAWWKLCLAYFDFWIKNTQFVGFCKPSIHILYQESLRPVILLFSIMAKIIDKWSKTFIGVRSQWAESVREIFCLCLSWWFPYLKQGICHYSKVETCKILKKEALLKISWL